MSILAIYSPKYEYRKREMMYNLSDMFPKYTRKLRMYRLGEIAMILGVCKETLRRWDRGGKLNAVHIGNRGDRRYRSEDVWRFIKTLN